MSSWQTIESAPKDGTEVITGKLNRAGLLSFQLHSRFIDGRWTAKIRGEWSSYDPQPTHWRPTTPPGEKEP